MLVLALRRGHENGGGDPVLVEKLLDAGADVNGAVGVRAAALACAAAGGGFRCRWNTHLARIRDGASAEERHVSCGACGPAGMGGGTAAAS